MQSGYFLKPDTKHETSSCAFSFPNSYQNRDLPVTGESKLFNPIQEKHWAFDGRSSVNVERKERQRFKRWFNIGICRCRGRRDPCPLAVSVNGASYSLGTVPTHAFRSGAQKHFGACVTLARHKTFFKTFYKIHSIVRFSFKLFDWISMLEAVYLSVCLYSRRLP